MGMIEGQALDMEGVPESASTEFLDYLYERKTGALFTCALTMGGLIAGASENQLGALRVYGSRLGLAFQITDDLIDVAGLEEKAGKKVGKDKEKGKKTYPHLIGMEESKKKVKDLLEEASIALKVFDESADPLQSLLSIINGRTN